MDIDDASIVDTKRLAYSILRDFEATVKVAAHRRLEIKVHEQRQIAVSSLFLELWREDTDQLVQRSSFPVPRLAAQPGRALGDQRQARCSAHWLLAQATAKAA